MARWRAVEPQRIEGPEWYRVYHPEAWDEPDGQELAMIGGCPSMRPWPAELHEHHARRRWHEAKYRYRQEHPALATQEVEDLISGRWERETN